MASNYKVFDDGRNLDNLWEEISDSSIYTASMSEGTSGEICTLVTNANGLYLVAFQLSLLPTVTDATTINITVGGNKAWRHTFESTPSSAYTDIGFTVVSATTTSSSADDLTVDYNCSLLCSGTISITPINIVRLA